MFTPSGKVVDLPPRASRMTPPTPGTAWRRRAGEPRLDGDDPMEGDDLDVPAFLRRQAD